MTPADVGIAAAILDDQKRMYKLQINWLREGKWEDTVYNIPTSYEVTLKRLNSLVRDYPEHEYRIISMMEVK